jgi:mitochondrial import inner membrane translocase subunit TIM10
MSEFRLSLRLYKECYAKCVPKVGDADLAIGEMSCVDRCVPKYMEVHAMVADEFKKLQPVLNPQPLTPQQ